VEIEFLNGKIVDIQGGLDSLLLRDFLQSYDDDTAFKAGHTSWGTDKRAHWHGLIKAINPEPGTSGADIEAHYGNIQIELGSNNDINFKGNISSNTHLGLCCRNSSLWLDDTLIIDSGKFVLAELQ
jgi:leucyl aminopeptidase (aminopeptidase T)